MNWEYNLGDLQVVVHNPDLDTREIIRRLEGSELFGEARIQPGRGAGQHQIQISLRGDVL